jgi:stearoyl-CoA desaturase (delta-9 desaturase)
MKSPYISIAIIWLFVITGLVSFFLADWSAWAVLSFFLFFAFGNGTVAHRYFSHNSFSVAPGLHWVLALWVTWCAYSPLAYWIVQHRHHHRFTDTPKDVHSPVNGNVNAFFLWVVDADKLKSVFDERSSAVNLIHAMKDPAIRFFSTHYVLVIAAGLMVLAAIDPGLVWAMTIAYVLEQIRLGIINTALHRANFPGNYVNFPSESDQSQNNILLGLLSLGFGWHNNHHHNPKKLILTHRWWEIDLEGYLGWLLSLTGNTHDRNTHDKNTTAKHQS